jgi:S1-C subfamily serine protease
VLGYPGGGNFTVGPAAVLKQLKAIGRDIYGNGRTLRDIYEVQAEIIPGNSGGPLVGKDGSVIGMVFAESTTYNHVGYALTTDRIATELDQAVLRDRTTSTGACTE